VLLDAGPLGAACNPLGTAAALACTKWLQSLALGGSRIIIPEIADYEVRRELVRAGLLRSVAQLDQLALAFQYLPISTVAIRKAAEFWALARNLGKPTAGDQQLDGDAILAAQAVTLNDPQAVIATTNVAHLSRFVAADLWHNITP
jgi:predicted nucleic acid-binding protein